MRPARTYGSLACLGLLSLGCALEPRERGGGHGTPPAGLPSAEERAVEYLAREVPLWSREKRCFSCHNDGDGTRALYAARAARLRVPASALAATSAWLLAPERWSADPKYREYGDPEFTSLQFAMALVAGTASGAIEGRAALARAADIVASGQLADGSWRGGSENGVGSPTAYSRHLATYAGARILAAVGAPAHAEKRRRAEAWLRARAPENVHQATVLLLGSTREGDFPGEARLAECLKLLAEGCSPGGGWGPYASSAPEAFDTALVLLGLARLKARLAGKAGDATGSVRDGGKPVAALEAWIHDGREFLRRTQQPDGSWRETTRPPGAESYAQRVSTTAWAVIALLATR